MELLLWRWSTAVQIVSALMVMFFFITLYFSVRRVELRPWLAAWVANAIALFVTIAYWYLQPNSYIAFWLVRVGYFAAKTAFVLLLVEGAAAFIGLPFERWRRPALVSVAIYAVTGAFLLPSIPLIGVAQSGLLAVLFALGAIILARTAAPAALWLAAAFAARAAFAAIETVAYASGLSTSIANAWPSAGTALAVHSSFDAAAEWTIALGCVLMMYRTIQQELTQANDGLVAAHEELRDLVDRDPGTGLANRRALPSIFRDVYESGATLLFFDLNDFKEINDSYGHHAGDECLRRFALALQNSFRPGDQVLRYAGDEFLVIAKGAEPAQIHDRIERLESLLRTKQSGTTIRISFSVGEAYLPARGDAEAALQAADAAMYRDKSSRKVGS